MHTKTHLKAALHQLSLAKVETQDAGHHALSEHIAEAEGVIVSLIREYYAVSQATPQPRLSIIRPVAQS